MKWHENRILAWIALALSVALSVFGLGGMYIARQRAKALTVFTEGSNPKQAVRHSMDAYLDHASECAGIMASEAERLQGSSQLTLDILDESVDLAKDSATLEARYAVYVRLKGHVDQLYNTLYNSVTKDDFKSFKLAYDDFWGDDDMIRHDSYPGLARSYNRLISGFPAVLVARLTGSGKLETFGG